MDMASKLFTFTVTAVEACGTASGPAGLNDPQRVLTVGFRAGPARRVLRSGVPAAPPQRDRGSHLHLLRESPCMFTHMRSSGRRSR